MEIPTNERQQMINIDFKIEISEKNYQPLLPVAIGLTELLNPTYIIRNDNKFHDYIIEFTGVWKSLILDFDHFADTDLVEYNNIHEFIKKKLESINPLIASIIKICRNTDGVLLSSFNLFVIIYLIRTKKLLIPLDEDVIKRTILFNHEECEITKMDEFLRQQYRMTCVNDYGFELPPICKQYTTKPYDRLSQFDISVINGLTKKSIVWIPRWKGEINYNLHEAMNGGIGSHHGEFDVKCPHYFKYMNHEGLMYDVLNGVVRNWRMMLRGSEERRVLSTRYNYSLGLFNTKVKMYGIQVIGSGYPHINFNLNVTNLKIVYGMVINLIPSTFEIGSDIMIYQPPVGSNILPFPKSIGETYIKWKVMNLKINERGISDNVNLSYKRVEIHPDTDVPIRLSNGLHNLKGLLTFRSNELDIAQIIGSMYSGFLIDISKKDIAQVHVDINELEDNWVDYHERLKFELSRFNPLLEFKYESGGMLEKMIEIAKEINAVLYMEVETLFRKLVASKITLFGFDIEFLSIYLLLVRSDYYSQIDAHIGIISDYPSNLIKKLNELRRVRYIKSYNEVFGNIQLGGDINSVRLVSNYLICYLSIIKNEDVYDYVSRIIKLMNYLNNCIRRAYLIKIPYASEEVLKMLSNGVSRSFSRVSVIHLANHYNFDGGVWFECITNGIRGFDYTKVITEYGLEYLNRNMLLTFNEPKMTEINSIGDVIRLQRKVGYEDHHYGICLSALNYNDFKVNLSICSQIMKNVTISKFKTDYEELVLTYGMCDPFTCRLFGRSGTVYQVSDLSSKRLYPVGKVDSSTIRTYVIHYGMNMKIGSLMNYAIKIYAKIKYEQYLRENSDNGNSERLNGHVFDIGGRQFESVDFVNKSDQWTIHDPFLQSDVMSNNCRVSYFHESLDLTKPFDIPDDTSVIIAFFLLQDSEDTVQSLLNKIINLVNVAKKNRIPLYFNVYCRASREYIKDIPGLTYDGNYGTFDGYDPVVLLDKDQVIKIDPQRIKALQLPKAIIIKLMCRYLLNYPIEIIHKFDVISEFVGLFRFEP